MSAMSWSSVTTATWMEGKSATQSQGLAGAVARDDRRGVGQAEVGRGDADVGGDDLSALSSRSLRLRSASSGQMIGAVAKTGTARRSSSALDRFKPWIRGWLQTATCLRPLHSGLLA